MKNDINSLLSDKKVFNQAIFSLILILVLSYTFILTNGDMNLAKTESFGCTYTSSWDSLLKGQFNIKPECIGFEAFIKDGKTYSYFGIFPSLLRGFIEFFIKRGDKDWSRLSTLLASVLIVVFSTWAFVIKIKKFDNSFDLKITHIFYYGLTVAYGSVILTLLSSSYIYHESILWGLAWVVLFIWSLIRTLESSKLSRLNIFLMSISAGFALLSKVTFAISTAPTLLIILFSIIASHFNASFSLKPIQEVIDIIKPKLELDNKTFKKIMLCGFLPFIFCFFLSCTVNYGKWGNPFSFAPLKYHQLLINNPNRLKAIEQNGVYNLSRFPYALCYYFIPSPLIFSESFPNIKISNDHPLFNDLRNFKVRFINNAHFDGVEPGNPITINSFYLIILSIIGIFALRKKVVVFPLLLISPFVLQAFLNMILMGLSLRYASEFMPILLILSLLSFPYVLTLEEKNVPYLNKKVKFLTPFLVWLGVLFSVQTTLEQKIFLWSVEGQYKQKIYSFYNKVNSFIYGVGNYDPHNLNFTMKINCSNFVLGNSYPILETGKEGVGDFIYVRYDSPNQVAFAHDHWGGGGVVGGNVYLNLESLHDVEINLPTERKPYGYVKLDGLEVLQIMTSPYPVETKNIKFGLNDINGTSCSSIFPGKIWNVRQLN